MAFVLPDWVWETTTTTGTGAVTLAGAVSGYRAFSSQLANGDTCYYSLFDGTNFEEGLGTYASAGNTLTRTTVYRSTNAGAAVNWGAGTRQIMASPLGVTQQSLFTPGSTGFPNRSADNTWSYYTTNGSGTVIPLATGATLTGPTLAAGTATVAPLTLTSGTNLTTAAAGAVEYDGVVHYRTNNASNRGLSPSVQYAIFNNTTYTLTAQTTAQKLFNTSTNGAITLPTGIFEFECYYYLTNLSSTSGTTFFGLAVGTATFSCLYTVFVMRNAVGGSSTVISQSVNTTGVSTSSSSGTATAATLYVKGMIRVTVSGTIIPSMNMSVASAAVVNAGSYFKINQIANTTNQTIGNWS
jgi:hypothetical protein